MGLPHQRMSWLVPTCMIWGVGFLIACFNLRDHFQGERNGQKVYRWPPRLFREVICLRPLWPVVFFLPAVLWPVWMIVFIIRESMTKDMDVDIELELETPRSSRGFPSGAWELGRRGRKGFESQRPPIGTNTDFDITAPPPAYWP